MLAPAFLMRLGLSKCHSNMEYKRADDLIRAGLRDETIRVMGEDESAPILMPEQANLGYFDGTSGMERG